MVRPQGTDMRVKTVFIIRHAEKPSEGSHLSDTGYERAQALVKLFGDCFCKPDALFAAPNKPKSFRPVETLEPLAAALGLAINAEFKTTEVDRLAEHLRGAGAPAGRIVLISWRHEEIPSLARALGAHDAPKDWPEAVFDRVWRILFLTAGQVRFADLAQGLLPGDGNS